jgi:hypothetical protein
MDEIQNKEKYESYDLKKVPTHCLKIKPVSITAYFSTGTVKARMNDRSPGRKKKFPN